MLSTDGVGLRETSVRNLNGTTGTKRGGNKLQSMDASWSWKRFDFGLALGLQDSANMYLTSDLAASRNARPAASGHRCFALHPSAG